LFLRSFLLFLYKCWFSFIRSFILNNYPPLCSVKSLLQLMLVLNFLFLLVLRTLNGVYLALWLMIQLFLRSFCPIFLKFCWSYFLSNFTHTLLPLIERDYLHIKIRSWKRVLYERRRISRIFSGLNSLNKNKSWLLKILVLFFKVKKPNLI
jgi:hypothetical protein